MKKTYLIEHGFNGEVKVEINHTPETEKLLSEINSFWSGAQDRLDSSDGNVTHAVLKMLATEVLQFQLESGYHTQCIIDSFDWDKKRGHEGWPKMDGTAGIRIVDVTPFEWEDMSVSEVSG